MLSLKFALRFLFGLVVLAAVSLGIYQIYDINRIFEITIAAGSRSNDTYEFAEAFAKIVAEVEPNIHLVLVETEGSPESAEMVQSEKADLGIIQMQSESGSQIRLIALLYPELFHLTVQADSNIQTPADLKGKVVATTEETFLDVLKYYGIEPNTLTVLPLSSEEAFTAFLDREVDATFRWSEPGSDRVKKLVQQGQGRLVPFSQFESMRLTIPYLVEFTLPRGLYQGGNPTVPPTDLTTVGSYKALVANTKMDPAIVRTITRTLFEQQNTLIARVPRSIYIRSPLTTQMVGPSLHPGAQAYYDRDKPGFFEQYENEISFVFTAGPLLISVLFALWARFKRKQHNQAKLHIQAVHNALVRLTETKRGQDTEVVEQRLLKILAQFTKDLNDGNIDPEDAQTFSMIWDKAIKMTQDRKKLADLSIS